MPTGMACGDGAWNALSTSVTKMAAKAAWARMKPA
jgi:hypothetical protein